MYTYGDGVFIDEGDGVLSDVDNAFDVIDGIFNVIDMGDGVFDDVIEWVMVYSMTSLIWGSLMSLM